ncbi:MAG: ABC transporter ATP-binding protein [Chloroflexia bacterium]
MIQTWGLTRHFDGRPAVEGLELEVHEGEVFGLLGPNGAGKTTTVRMLTALLAPTSGSAVVAGFRLGEQDMEIRRHVGLLTEAPGLYERLPVQYNLEVFARLYEVPEREIPGRVEHYLRMLDLWERRRDPAGTLSKGMKQKLAVARALLHEPRVLFLDEPTASLDPEASRMVRDFIADLKKEGRTIVLCTHNLDEADRLCDRIAVLKQRLIRVDTPENLRRALYGRAVCVQLREVRPEYLRVVRALPFVREVVEHGQELQVHLDDPEGMNPLLVRALVEAGAEVQFVREEEHTLEQVYLDLVREEKEAGR